MKKLKPILGIAALGIAFVSGYEIAANSTEERMQRVAGNSEFNSALYTGFTTCMSFNNMTDELCIKIAKMRMHPNAKAKEKYALDWILATSFQKIESPEDLERIYIKNIKSIEAAYKDFEAEKRAAAQ